MVCYQAVYVAATVPQALLVLAIVVLATALVLSLMTPFGTGIVAVTPVQKSLSLLHMSNIKVCLVRVLNHQQMLRAFYLI